MIKVLMISLCLFGCSNRYYDPELYFLGAHTKEEWEIISNNNIQDQKCLEKNKNLSFQKQLKICNLKIISEVGL